MSRVQYVSESLPKVAAPDANFYFLLKQIHDANVQKQAELDELHASLASERDAGLQTQSQLELANVTQDKRVELAESRTAQLHERMARQSASMASMDAEIAELRQKTATVQELKSEVKKLGVNLRSKSDECTRLRDELREAQAKNRHFENMLDRVQSLSQLDRASLRTMGRVSFAGVATAGGSNHSIKSHGSATTFAGAGGQQLTSQEPSLQSFQMGGASAALHLKASDSRSTTATMQSHQQPQPQPQTNRTQQLSSSSSSSLQYKSSQQRPSNRVDQSSDTNVVAEPIRRTLRTSDQTLLMPGTDLQRSLRSRAELIRQRYLQN